MFTTLVTFVLVIENPNPLAYHLPFVVVVVAPVVIVATVVVTTFVVVATVVVTTFVVVATVVVTTFVVVATVVVTAVAVGSVAVGSVAVGSVIVESVVAGSPFRVKVTPSETQMTTTATRKPITAQKIIQPLLFLLFGTNTCMVSVSFQFCLSNH